MVGVKLLEKLIDVPIFKSVVAWKIKQIALLMACLHQFLTLT